VQPDDVLKQDWMDFEFTRDIWGKGERDLFLRVLKEGMACRAGRERGRGRGRGGDYWGEGQNWWNTGYPPHPGFPPPHFQPPFGFYPHPPSLQYPHQPPMQFQGVGQGQGHQQHLNDPRKRPQNNEGFRPSGVQQRQRQDRQEEPKLEEEKRC
jgi:hypothetical protein